MYQAKYAKRSQKQLKDLPRNEQVKILAKISKILEEPRKFGVKLIDTKPPIYRMRVGEYRIFFELDIPTKTMMVTDVLRRTTQTYR